MDTRQIATTIGLLALVIMFSSACGQDEVGGGVSHLCPDGECVSCDGEGDCDSATFCHEEGVCAEVICEPNSGKCDGSAVVRCNEYGSGHLEPETCDTGVCEGGQCGCSDEEDCAEGEACSGGLCECSTEVFCGDDGICCGDGESCVQAELCDDDGNCEQFRECRPKCEGSICGFDGELCCDGDTPECGPQGQCAPNCDNGGGLCGENFDQCCAWGEVCIFGECRLPGDDCEHFTECDFGEYCDQGLGKCMPDDFPDDLICEDEYDFAEIEPEVLWQWDGEEINGNMYSNVMMTPLVADMTGDGVPNVIVNAYRDTGGSNSIPVVIDGATGETAHYYAHRFTDFGTQLAAVDITGNDVPEIVAVDNGSGGIGVIENIVDCPDPQTRDDGCYLWWNDQDVHTNQGAPVVADLNADGNVEIVLRDSILDAMTGELIATLDAGGYDYTVAVDVTGDGRLEILGAGCLYSLNQAHDLTELWCTDQPVATEDRRFVAVGDLTDENGRDGLPEFVITGDGSAYVVAADTGEVLHIFDLPGGGAGGSPIIADFDGDGSAEFGVAGAACYTVFDLDCLVPDAENDNDLMEDRPGCQRPQIETCEFGHHCACEDLVDTGGTGDGVLWSIYVQDASSHRTGSSVFDFQGNGRNEVVYNDECLLMVLDGQDGSPYFRYGNTNRTSSEYPLVVDVNGDHQTNIVVSANNDEFARDCETPIATRPERFPECHPDDGDAPAWCTEGTHGVVALQDPQDRWVRTRSIWNQFDYYIDNATDTAGVPISPAMPWESHNTFRANRQGDVPLNAPDVVVSSVQANARSCPVDIDFRATIQNMGVAAIPADMPVSLYYFGADDELVYVETLTIGVPISPGGMVTVDFTYQIITQQLNQEVDFLIVANDDGEEGAPVRDCNPDNASALVEGVVCEYQL